MWGGPRARPCQASPSCLSHGGREQNTPSLPPFWGSARSRSPCAAAGACAHRNRRETPRRGSAFSCCERRWEEWGKAKPGEAAGLAVPAPWVGGEAPSITFAITFASLLPPCLPRRDCLFSIRVGHKQNKSLGRMLPFLSPLCGLAPGSRDCNWFQTLAGLCKQTLPQRHLSSHHSTRVHCAPRTV